MKLLAIALVIATSACVVGDEMPTEDDLPPPYSEAALTNNARTAFNYFVAKGLTKIQAAGVVGNLMQESNVRPTAVQLGGGPGRGIAQWSIGGRWNSGRNSLVSFASARGLDRWALQTQLDFIWFEMATVGGYGLAELRAATTITAAVRAFQNKYEICGACEQGQRVQYAQEALTAYGNGGGGTPTNDGPTCFSGTLDRDMPENACVQSVFDNLWYQCVDGEWVDRWSEPSPCNGEFPL